MDFDEEKYQVKSSSDYWADVVKGIEVFDEDEEENEDTKSEIFKCKSCGAMYDLANMPKYLHPFNYYIVKNDPLTVKCPNCNKVVLYETATKEEYDKYIEKKEKQKEEKQKQVEEKAKNKKIDQIKDDLKDLAKDLKERLFNKEISPKRFAVLFTNMSKNIVNRYGGKKLDVDWLEFRKTIYELSDGILEVYKAQEKTEEILEEYTENIEDDELYKAELEYYIEDNQYAIPDYELRQRIKEYDRQEAKIRSDEYKKEIEEKYQKRRNELLQKAEERQRRQKLRDIM